MTGDTGVTGVAAEPGPLPARPAASVILIRDTAEGLGVFLMRRHRKMDFAAGVMVFPGGGVDERDRNPDIAWAGPDPHWWATRLGTDAPLAAALVCAAARETFEESGVLFAGPADDPGSIVGDTTRYGRARRELTDNTLSFAEFLREEHLVLRADLLRPWDNWVTPESERVRRYDTFFLVGVLPAGQQADGENSESDLAGWSTVESALTDFTEGRTVLLPPTWCQLDSLAGRTVAEVLAEDRSVVAVRPVVDGNDGMRDVAFFDSARYHAARSEGARHHAARRGETGGAPEQ